MCGIIGATSSRSVGKILVNGLKRMEYRGYDSAGLVLNQKEKAHQLRTLGKVSNLEELMAKKKPAAKSGIAHTRWATHGKPNQTNAHPHFSGDKKLTIIHNGIIENYDALKQTLINKGHVFKSDTDTEVLVHLIEDIRNNESANYAWDGSGGSMTEVRGSGSKR